MHYSWKYKDDFVAHSVEIFLKLYSRKDSRGITKYSWSCIFNYNECCIRPGSTYRHATRDYRSLANGRTCSSK